MNKEPNFYDPKDLRVLIDSNGRLGEYDEILKEIRLLHNYLDRVCEDEDNLRYDNYGCRNTDDQDRIAFRNILNKRFWDWLELRCSLPNYNMKNTFGIALVMYHEAMKATRISATDTAKNDSNLTSMDDREKADKLCNALKNIFGNQNTKKS